MTMAYEIFEFLNQSKSLCKTRPCKRDSHSVLDLSSDTGTIVGHLEAVHNEGHKSLMYSVLEDDGDGLFLLNPHSGEFLLSRTLDFESEQFYILTAAVQYRDSQLTRVRVYFNVADVNDIPPVFKLNAYSLSLKEDAHIDLCFFNLNVSDADDG